MNIVSLEKLCSDKEYLHDILVSDFIERPFITSLPSDFNNITSDRLSDIHLLQIISIKDIKKSDRHKNESKKSDSRMLRMQLTDGKQTIIAYEYKYISELDSVYNNNIRCLAKIALFNNPVIIRGTLWLVPENLKVLFQGFKCISNGSPKETIDSDAINTIESHLKKDSNSNYNNQSILFNQKISLNQLNQPPYRNNNDSYQLSNTNYTNSLPDDLFEDKIKRNTLFSSKSTIKPFKSPLVINTNENSNGFYTEFNEKDRTIVVINVEEEWEDIKSPENVFGDKLSECSFYTYLAHTKYRSCIENHELLYKALVNYSMDILNALSKKYSIFTPEIHLLASKMSFNEIFFSSYIKKQPFYATISKAIILNGHCLSSQLWLLELLVTAQPIIYSLADQNTLQLYCSNSSTYSNSFSNLQINISTSLYNFVGYISLSVYDYKGRPCIWLSDMKANNDNILKVFM